VLWYADRINYAGGRADCIIVTLPFSPAPSANPVVALVDNKLKYPREPTLCEVTQK
jgi:hypothetical protein